MKLRSFLTPIFLLPVLVLAQSVLAQSGPVPIYAESFRHGSTRILEEKFEVKLSQQEKTYSERLKDSHGSDRYVLSITPVGPEGDTSVTSWQVKLTDLSHRFYDNILLTSLQEDPANDPKNQLCRLNPSKFASVPIRAERIIKVDDFYMVLEVKSYHFTPIDSPYLDSMNVTVEFTNTDPRTSTDGPK